MAGHAIAPEEGQRVVGQRADHGDAGIRAQRQGGVPVDQQHDGLLGQPPGERAVTGRVEVDDRTVPGGAVLAGIVLAGAGPVRVEQAQVAFLPQDPGRGPVDQGGRQLAAPYRADQRRAVAGEGGQLHVQAGRQGQRAGLPRRRGHRVLGRQERDRVVVGDDQAVEAQFVPEQPGQQLAVGRDRYPVDIEGRAPGQRRREDRGRPGGEAGQALLVRDPPRRRRRVTPGRVTAFVLATVWLVIVIAPIYYMVLASFRSQGGYLTENPWLPSGGLTVSEYGTVFGAGLGRYLVNSVIITAVCILLTLSIGLGAAFRIVRHSTRAAGASFRILLMAWPSPSRPSSCRSTCWSTRRTCTAPCSR